MRAFLFRFLLVPLIELAVLHPTLDPKAQKKIIARGLPASPGAGPRPQIRLSVR